MKLFGTDGVRGVVNVQITPELCFKIGKTLGVYLKNIENPCVVIAKDTRTTCDMIFTSLASGLLSCGVKVVDAGILSTPALSFITKTNDFDLGIMITASHNSAEFNGIKFFDKFGNKPSLSLEKSLQKIYNNLKSYQFVSFDKYQKVVVNHKLKNKYVKYLQQILSTFNLNKKICFDLSNGTANYILKPLLKHFKNYVLIGDDTKGDLVNKGCGATNIDTLVKAVQNNSCDIGFAFDGDADRIIMVLNNGRIIDGDDILYILARYLKDNKLLTNNTVVGTIMSNFGLQDALRKQNIRLIRVNVGDKYIVDYLAGHKLSLGGEQAGHIIISAFTNTGDGILTCLVLLKALQYYGNEFENILNQVQKYPQVIKNVLVEDGKKQKILQNKNVIQTLQVCEGSLLDDGRIVLRASGTEPMIRVMVEGKDNYLIQSIASTLTGAIIKCKNQI